MKDKIKIMVINNSYQICKFFDDNWVVCDVKPENGVLRGIYYLERAKKADISKPFDYEGTVLFISSNKNILYQLVDDEIIMHPAGIHTKGIKVGQAVKIKYS